MDSRLSNNLEVTAADLDEAYKIEAAPSHTDPDVVQRCRDSGILQVAGTMTEAFTEHLSDRVRMIHDRNGQESQQSSPVAVGCSINLSLRMSTHDFSKLEASTPCPMILLARCLAVVDLKPEIPAVLVIEPGSSAPHLHMSVVAPNNQVSIHSQELTPPFPASESERNVSRSARH